MIHPSPDDHERVGINQYVGPRNREWMKDNFRNRAASGERNADDMPKFIEPPSSRASTAARKEPTNKTWWKRLINTILPSGFHKANTAFGPP